MSDTGRYQSNYEIFLYGTFGQTLLYGIYVTTLAHCLRWLLLDDEGWKIRRRINWSMLIICILLVLLSTTDLAMTLKSLIDYGDLQSAAKNTMFIDVFSALEGGTLLIVDGVLIYRLWIVYQKSWGVTCPPIVLWLGSLTCAILLNFYDVTVYTGILKRTHIIVTFFASNIVINLYATSLIVYRILRAAHDIKAFGRAGHLYRATRVIAESGILYTLTSLFHLIAELQFDPIVAEMGRRINFSMAGIAFNLILIRVGQNRSASDVDESRPSTQRATKEGQLSTLQFIAPSATSSLAAVEEGIHKR